MPDQVTKLCLVAVATWAVGCAGAACERGVTWWNRQLEECKPCTRCDPSLHQAVKFPCEIHRDTICHSIYELDIWPFNIRSQNISAKDVEEINDEDYTDYEVLDSVKWDSQTWTFIVAASGCVIFFVVVLTLTLYHSKQWRKLKQALQSDVQDLSAKLKLMESGAEPVTERIASTDHHIYCNIHVSKDVLMGKATGKQGFGNVYTEEK